MRKKAPLLCTIVVFVTFGFSFAQVPVPTLDQGLIPPSPNAASFATFGIVPVSLYEGIPNVSLPIYNVKAGSLSLPISLDYNYNGLKPKQDASWVGLGWNLSAGGVITRVVQGQVDGSRSTGFNYGEYDLSANINNNTFQQSVYAGNYDIAPDVFIFNFPGHSGKFVYYNGTAYTFPHQKLLIYKPVNDTYIRITDENGIVYTFSDYEITNTSHPKPTDPIIAPFKSSWHLSQIVSANKKDTISFSYTGGYTYREYAAPYGQTIWDWVSGPLLTTMSDSISSQFNIAPNISSVALSTIDCNTTHISFTVTSSRDDISGGNYPQLESIMVTDKVRSAVIKQYGFSYEFFQNSSHSGLSDYERLKLKTFTDENSIDILPYTFYYANENSNFPIKNTYGIDFWGYYNGHDENTNLYTSDIYINLAGIRTPDFAHAVYGALDSIVYPTGGSTAFRYELNTYSGSNPGPGIRVKKVLSYGDNTTTPSLSKSYIYTNGNLFNENTSYASRYTYTALTGAGTSVYSIAQISLGSSFGGLIDNGFYYGNVTESDTVGTEIHRTDYEFTSFVNYLTGIDVTQKTDYVYSPSTGYKIRSNQDNNITFDPALNGIYVDCYSLLLTGTSAYAPTQTFTTSNNRLFSAWKYPTSQQATFYDDAGNAATITTNYYFNTTTTNLQETSTQASDGSYTLTKLKYPEDYTTAITGGLINKHVLSPVIEQQIWRKNSSTDSVMLSGKIVKYDTSLIAPVNEYYLETTTPLHTLSTETKTGGLYNTLVSDANYVNRVRRQFDTYGNLLEQDLSSNVNNSYIWAYNHSLPIAEVKNAGPNQIAYTSFETGEKGNWNYTGNYGSGGKTGDTYYQLISGNIVSNTLPAGGYIVSYWSDNSIGTITGGTVVVKVNGESDGTPNWKYYEQQVTLSAAGTITLSGTSNIDELRLFPRTAQMSTSTYQPGVGLTSRCSVNNKISYYRYDGHGRLITVLDQQKNILKTIQYNYKNANIVPF